MGNTWCTPVAGSRWSFWGRGIAFQFCEPICTYLVSGASYSSLNNANWELTKHSCSLAQSFWHGPYAGPEPELHIQVLKLQSFAESPESSLRTEAVVWHQCVLRSPSQWEVSTHKSLLLSFAACLLSSVVSWYTAILPYIVKASVSLQKQTARKSVAALKLATLLLTNKNIFPDLLWLGIFSNDFHYLQQNSLEGCWTR